MTDTRTTQPGDVTGCIFDIQRFSTRDGPGIRTTVFLKGCTLRCAWCHNPESIRPLPELQYFREKCTHCGDCAVVCPFHTMKNGVHRFDRSMCNGCGLCVDSCLHDALFLAGRDVRAEEVMQTVIRDRAYYQKSGGGLTVSGGEPLYQADFTAALFQIARESGISTALDTAVHVDSEQLKLVLPWTDLFLLDIKHMDSRRHAFHTGSGNERIQANAALLLESNARIIVRVPIIPGFNDDEKSQTDIRQWLEKAGNRIERVDYLPWHDLGKVKKESLR